VLVKGSRSAGMEQVVSALKEQVHSFQPPASGGPIDAA